MCVSLFFFSDIFKIFKLKLTYNIILVSAIQQSDQTSMYIMYKVISLLIFLLLKGKEYSIEPPAGQSKWSICLW